MSVPQTFMTLARNTQENAVPKYLNSELTIVYRSQPPVFASVFWPFKSDFSWNYAGKWLLGGKKIAKVPKNHHKMAKNKAIELPLPRNRPLFMAPRAEFITKTSNRHIDIILSDECLSWQKTVE
jgi:hypothetical protein